MQVRSRVFDAAADQGLVRSVLVRREVGPEDALDAVEHVLAHRLVGREPCEDIELSALSCAPLNLEISDSHQEMPRTSSRPYQVSCFRPERPFRRYTPRLGEEDSARGLALGPFTLLDPIGYGGMATVWRARHGVLGLPAAVKILSTESSSSARDPLRREVEAVAALHHPHIIRLYDFGEVPADSAGLRPGSAWLAMELAEGGSLLPTLFESWETVARCLLQILSALGHAHARGVVHRDLKPDNLLLAEGRAGRLRLKLTDFGIATLDASLDGEAPSVAGTPLYMAPEQIRGQWREYEPATDLYALGCVAQELLCGVHPFEADSTDDVLRRHLANAPAPFRPRFEVPDGTRQWVARLLAARGCDRYLRAADAARGLLSMDRSLSQLGSLWRSRHRVVTRPPRPTFDSDAEADPILTPLLETLEQTGPPLVPPSERSSSSAPPRPAQVIPSVVPVSWTNDALRPADDLLRGVGAGLFGVRQVPFVGRVPERDRLWRALRVAQAEASVAVALLRGPSGVGKTRLAEWAL